MTTYYSFECGCKIPVEDVTLKENDALPSMEIDYYNIEEACPATWSLIGTGRTKGIFQIESYLGADWSGKIQPTSINELAALISIIRPGCLQAIVDGKSMTEHYMLRKRGLEEVQYFCEAIRPALEETYGVLVYQEQAMKMAVQLAGFNPSEADSLRKAIGKKDAELMASLENTFVDGCNRKGLITDEQAKTIFGWIRESQRYQFNLSHGVGYGQLGYWTAYAKAHFPLHFYASWLYYAKEKMKPQEEMSELISEAKAFDISVLPPTLTLFDKGMCDNFSIDKDKIHFGLNNVKGMGESNYVKLAKALKNVEEITNKKVIDLNWTQYLLLVAPLVSTTVNNNLIAVGGLDYFSVQRNQMTFEYNILNQLSDNELKWLSSAFIAHEFKNLQDALFFLLNNKERLNKNRKAKIEDLITCIDNPPYELVDTSDYIASNERELLGISLTCTRLDNCDKSLATGTCRELADGRKGKMSVVVEILNSREHIIKKGRAKGEKMGFVSMQDDSGKADAVGFSNVWGKFKDVLYKGNTVLISGESSKNDSKSLVIYNVQQL